MLEIAESEDAQRELLDREKVKSKGGGLISLAPVADIERGSIEGSITASSRMTSVAGRSAVPDDKGRMSPSASKSEYHRVNASIPPGGSCRGSIARPGRFEDGSNGGMATSLRRSTDKAAEGKHSSSSGGGAEGNGRVRVPRVPGLAGEPLLTDVHPLVQTAIKNLNSAHALTAASMARAILESLDANDLEYLQQVRLFSLQKEFAAIYQEQRTTRVGLFFSLPIFLMFLRLSIQTLFSTNYPLWTRTKDGQESLASMDKVCCDLLDPHRYLERNLSILQSSPAAIDVIARNPSKGHEAESYHFTDTSRLLRSALLSPSSAATRRILVAQSQKDALKPQGKKQMLASKKLSTQLTFEQREELYQDARMLLETRKNLPAAAARKK